MRKKLAVRTALLLLTLPALCAAQAAAASYTYSYEGQYKEAPPMYVTEEVWDLSAGLEQAVKEPSSFFIDAEGRLYLADSGNNRVLVYSLADRTLLTALTGFTGPDGQTESFDRPSGVFAGEDGVVTVADTGNSRVVMLAPDYSLRQIVGSPTGSGVPSGYIFQPIAVAVDKSGRLYAVSRSSAMGVVSFNIDGEFEGFLGAQVVQPSAAELFWRRFMTAEQLERVQKILPTEFNSLTIDDSGFLYVTTSSISKESQYNALITRSRSGDFAPIRRLNPSGDDVLKRSGFFPPAGDVEIRTDGKKDSVVSAFVCAAIGDYGVYSVLDNTRKHIFTYDYDGNLLSVLGGEGVAADQFRALTHAAYHGGKLWVLDGYTGRLTVLRLSGYGTDIMEAIRLTQERQYAQALDTWTELLHKNGNLEMAYIGMGKAYMKSGDYAGAMECYRIVNNREGYSAAYAKQRNASLGNFLLLIPLLAAALALGIIRLSRKLKAYNRAGDLEAARVRGTGEQLAYGFHTIFHPFDGFDEMKRHGRGDVKGAGICLLAALLSFVLYRMASGYLFSDAHANLLGTAATFLLPLLVWCIGNWCVTSLMYG